MDELFKKIYDEVICYEEDIVKMSKIIENNSIIILKKYNDKLNENEEEIFLELIDDATSYAEREGFYMGMKYAFKIIAALFKK